MQAQAWRTLNSSLPFLIRLSNHSVFLFYLHFLLISSIISSSSFPSFFYAFFLFFFFFFLFFLFFLFLFFFFSFFFSSFFLPSFFPPPNYFPFYYITKALVNSHGGGIICQTLVPRLAALWHKDNMEAHSNAHQPLHPTTPSQPRHPFVIKQPPLCD